MSRTSGSFSITWPTCSPAARCPCAVVLMIRSARPSSQSALSISFTGGTAHRAGSADPSAGAGAGRVVVEGPGPRFAAAKRASERAGGGAAGGNLCCCRSRCDRSAGPSSRTPGQQPAGRHRQAVRGAAAGMPSGDLESDRARWTALLDVLDESRAEQLVQAVMRLADLGVDRSPRLDSLVEASMIAPDVQALAAAIAAAVATSPRACRRCGSFPTPTIWRRPRWRVFLPTPGCLMTPRPPRRLRTLRFGDPGFLVEAAVFLMQLGRPGDASAAASDALGPVQPGRVRPTDGPPHPGPDRRQDAESTAGTEASTRSWRRAESHFTECTSRTTACAPIPTMPGTSSTSS